MTDAGFKSSQSPCVARAPDQHAVMAGLNDSNCWVSGGFCEYLMQ